MHTYMNISSAHCKIEVGIPAKNGAEETVVFLVWNGVCGDDVISSYP